MRALIAAVLTILGGPLLAQIPDTSLYTPSTEVRIGVAHVAFKRVVSVPSGNVSFANGNLRGAEFFVLAAQGGGLRLRYETGKLPGGGLVPAAGSFETLDGRIILGNHSFAVVPGFALRNVDWNAKARRFQLPQAGIEIGRYFRGAALQVKVAGMYKRTIKADDKDSVSVAGADGRTSVLYAPPRFPVFFELGYRREVLSYKRDGIQDRREESSGVLLTIGLQAGMAKR